MGDMIETRHKNEYLRPPVLERARLLRVPYQLGVLFCGMTKTASFLGFNTGASPYGKAGTGG